MRRQLTILALITVTTIVLAAPAAAASLEQELARARAATAKYHDLSQAEADGYVQDLCHEGEGCHWFNWDLYDGTFDPEHPEALIYTQSPNGGWRLVAVEYIVPGESDPPQPAPEGFTGDEDVWLFGTEGFPDWELTAWIWFNNPDGVFARENPRLGHEEEH